MSSKKFKKVFLFISSTVVFLCAEPQCMENYKEDKESSYHTHKNSEIINYLKNNDLTFKELYDKITTIKNKYPEEENQVLFEKAKKLNTYIVNTFKNMLDVTLSSDKKHHTTQYVYKQINEIVELLKNK